MHVIQSVPLATEPDISLIILPLLLRVATIRRTTDTFLFISHTTNVLLFKFRCNIFIGVRIIKEKPGSVASGTPYIFKSLLYSKHYKSSTYTCHGQTRGHPQGGVYKECLTKPLRSNVNVT